MAIFPLFYCALIIWLSPIVIVLFLFFLVMRRTGMKHLFVHVNADNKPAQELYKKTGFKVGI